LFSSGVLEKRWKCIRSISTTVAASRNAFFDVTILEHSVPDLIRSGVLVEDAGIRKRLLGINHWIERVVVDLDRLGAVVRDCW